MSGSRLAALDSDPPPVVTGGRRGSVHAVNLTEQPSGLLRGPLVAAGLTPARDTVGVEIPSTATGLVVILLFALPGFVYQATRTWLRGPGPTDVGVSSRLIRALIVSVITDGIYAVTLGPYLLGLASESDPAFKYSTTELTRHVRAIGAIGLVLFVAVPFLVALAELGSVWLRATIRARYPNLPRPTYDPEPRAWDATFRRQLGDKDSGGGVFVRVLTASGKWVAGWYSSNSFASSFPEPRELFLEVAHFIDDDGKIGDEVPDSEGIYVRCDDAVVVDLVRGDSSQTGPPQLEIGQTELGAPPARPAVDERHADDQTGAGDGIDSA